MYNDNFFILDIAFEKIDYKVSSQVHVFLKRNENQSIGDYFTLAYYVRICKHSHDLEWIVLLR